MRRAPLGFVVLAAALLVGGVTAGCSDGGSAGASAGAGLTVTTPAVGATGATDTAAYLTIENHGAADRLVGVTSPDGARVTMHRTDTSGGASTMVSADSLDVPARSSLRLDPGGSHLMVEGLPAAIRAGDRVRLHLTFEHAPPVDVVAPAVPLQDLPDRIARP
ncbi:MAG: copper chaperone PCu(A)C [Actinobacteria bacterium]|nr:copper chaperone PCu(A)C [Actinomycetota bacterium]